MQLLKKISLIDDLVWGLYISDLHQVRQGDLVTVVSRDSLALLRQHVSVDSEIGGLVMVDDGPMIVSSRAVVHSDTTGPISGSLVVGRLIDDQQVARLRETAEVDLGIENLETPRPTGDPSTMFGPKSESATRDTRTVSQDLVDIHGNTVARLQVRSPRDISALGRGTNRTVALLSAGLGSTVLFGLWFILRKLVITPVQQLRTRMRRIQQDGDLSERLAVTRADEIGDLGASFDSMLDKLQTARREHIDQSFQAGMAEVAAGVLHNVRNSMMPILNHVELANAASTRYSLETRSTAISDFRDRETASDRRDKLLRFLALRADKDRENVDEIGTHLSVARDQLDQVLDILRDQEKLTHASPIIEKVNLGELVREASGVVPANGDCAVDAQLAEELDDYAVRAHRVGFLQVLSNVLLNAYESIDRSGNGSGRIRVGADTTSDNEVQVFISDTGSGISADLVDHIFDRGYTSKTEGAGGLGLHWSANAMVGMQGRIEASSDGPGRGAEFRVSLMAA